MQNKAHHGHMWQDRFQNMFVRWIQHYEYIPLLHSVHEGVSKSFRTGRLERQLQMIQLSATRCSCIAILWVSLVNFAAITLCVASQRVFIVAISLSTQSGNFWTRSRIYYWLALTLWTKSHWDANSRSAAQETTPPFLWNPKVHHRVHKSPQWTLSWARCIQSTSSRAATFKSILTLSSHLSQVSPVITSVQVFRL
jgi:hypothetical protein